MLTTYFPVRLYNPCYHAARITQSELQVWVRR